MSKESSEQETNEDVMSKSEQPSMKNGNKVSPPLRSGANWKPGDLLRKVFAPSAKKSSKSEPTSQESPVPEPGPAQDPDNTPKDSAKNESGETSS